MDARGCERGDRARNGSANLAQRSHRSRRRRADPLATSERGGDAGGPAHTPELASKAGEAAVEGAAHTVVVDGLGAIQRGEQERVIEGCFLDAFVSPGGPEVPAFEIRLEEQQI